MLKLVVVKGEFAGQERRGWFPVLTGQFNLTGKSDVEASTTEDPEKLDWMIEFARSLLGPYSEIRVLEIQPDFKAQSLKFLN